MATYVIDPIINMMDQPFIQGQDINRIILVDPDPTVGKYLMHNKAVLRTETSVLEYYDDQGELFKSVDLNPTDLDSVLEAIAAANIKITQVEAKVDKNTDDIKDVDSTATEALSIAKTNQDFIQGIDPEDVGNIVDAIAKNESDIKTNASDIALNVASIESQKISVENNSETIKAVEVKVDNLQTKVTEAQSDIALIQEVIGETGDHPTGLHGAINENTNEISSLKSVVNTQADEIKTATNIAESAKTEAIANTAAIAATDVVVAKNVLSVFRLQTEVGSLGFDVRSNTNAIQFEKERLNKVSAELEETTFKTNTNANNIYNIDVLQKEHDQTIKQNSSRIRVIDGVQNDLIELVDQNVEDIVLIKSDFKEIEEVVQTNTAKIDLLEGTIPDFPIEELLRSNTPVSVESLSTISGDFEHLLYVDDLRSSDADNRRFQFYFKQDQEEDKVSFIIEENKVSTNGLPLFIGQSLDPNAAVTNSQFKVTQDLSVKNETSIGENNASIVALGQRVSQTENDIEVTLPNQISANTDLINSLEESTTTLVDELEESITDSINEVKADVALNASAIQQAESNIVSLGQDVAQNTNDINVGLPAQISANTELIEALDTTTTSSFNQIKADVALNASAIDQAESNIVSLGEEVAQNTNDIEVGLPAQISANTELISTLETNTTNSINEVKETADAAALQAEQNKQAIDQLDPDIDFDKYVVKDSEASLSSVTFGNSTLINHRDELGLVLQGDTLYGKSSEGYEHFFIEEGKFNVKSKTIQKLRDGVSEDDAVTLRQLNVVDAKIPNDLSSTLYDMQEDIDGNNFLALEANARSQENSQKIADLPVAPNLDNYTQSNTDVSFKALTVTDLINITNEAGATINFTNSLDLKLGEASKVTVSSDLITLTNNLSLSNNQITNLASGGNVDTNAATIADVKNLVASGGQDLSGYARENEAVEFTSVTSPKYVIKNTVEGAVENSEIHISNDQNTVYDNVGSTYFNVLDKDTGNQTRAFVVDSNARLALDHELKVSRINNLNSWTSHSETDKAAFINLAEENTVTIGAHSYVYIDINGTKTTGFSHDHVNFGSNDYVTGISMRSVSDRQSSDAISYAAITTSEDVQFGKTKVTELDFRVTEGASDIFNNDNLNVRINDELVSVFRDNEFKLFKDLNANNHVLKSIKHLVGNSAGSMYVGNVNRIKRDDSIDNDNLIKFNADNNEHVSRKHVFKVKTDDGAERRITIENHAVNFHQSQLNNVADATNDKDAVNLAQVNALVEASAAGLQFENYIESSTGTSLTIFESENPNALVG